MSKKKSRCDRDCFNCIYDDCIEDKVKLSSANKDRTEYFKEYYQKNKERRQQYFKEYYQENKERIKANHNKRYRSRKKQV